MDLFSQDVGADFADATGFDAMVGGSPTNIAIGTCRLGLRSIAFTAVGDDPVGDFVLRSLEADGVVCDHVHRKPGKLTSLALLGVKPPDEFPLAFYREDPADIHLTVDDARRLPFEDAKAMLLSGNALSRGTCAEAVTHAMERARDSGLATFMDLDLRPTEWKRPSDYSGAMLGVMEFVDTLVGTEEELGAAFRLDPGTFGASQGMCDSDRRELDALLSHNAKSGIVDTTVVKRGPRGVSVITGAGRIDVSGFEVEVVNTVGAGDAFASGLIWARLQGKGWEDAARFANACGAIVVTRHGCSSAFPTLEEVEGFIAAAER